MTARLCKTLHRPHNHTLPPRGGLISNRSWRRSIESTFIDNLNEVPDPFRAPSVIASDSKSFSISFSSSLNFNKGSWFGVLALWYLFFLHCPYPNPGSLGRMTVVHRTSFGNSSLVALRRDLVPGFSPVLNPFLSPSGDSGQGLEDL